MSVADFTEALMAIIGTSMTATTLYLSIVSGFLVVGYTVGAQLSRFQLAVVSTLFVLFAFFFAVSTFSLVTRANEFILNYGTGDFQTNAATPYIIFSIECLGIVAAVAFMMHSRRK